MPPTLVQSYYHELGCKRNATNSDASANRSATNHTLDSENSKLCEASSPHGNTHTKQSITGPVPPGSTTIQIQLFAMIAMKFKGGLSSRVIYNSTIISNNMIRDLHDLIGT